MPIIIRNLGVEAHDSTILHDISTTINDGTITLLIGKTGAGKSTLLEVLAGVNAPSTGSALFNGQSLWQQARTSETILRQIGYVFQYPEQQLFASTVLREFKYSLRPLRLAANAQLARIHQTLAALELSPDILEASPLTLSGGMKRRVALATTLATQPSWLFLDEPTAGLDMPAVHDLAHMLLERKAQGTTCVIATHDLEQLLPLADHVLVLKEGRLVANTPANELSHHAEVLREANIGVPAFIQFSLNLRAVGCEIPAWPPDTAMMAQHISHFVQSTVKTQTKIDERRGSNTKMSVSDSEIATADPVTHTDKTTLDARAKWLFYIFTSVGTFLQTGIFGLATATAIAIAVVVSQTSILSALAKTKPLVYVMIASTLLSGVDVGAFFHTWHVQDIGFSWRQGEVTFKSLYRIFLLFMLGIWFMSSTSSIEMKGALDRVLLRIAVVTRAYRLLGAFSLAFTLMLRLIPVIFQSFERFSKIIRVRGKSSAKAHRLRIRDLPVLIIPLTMSLLQFGEDMATALHARGYDNHSLQHSIHSKAGIQRRDVMFIILGVTLFCVLFITRQL